MRRGPRRHHNPNRHIQPLTTSTVEKLLYGAPLPDIHTQRRLEEARKQAHTELAKEKEMPDMKTALETALKKTINEWDNDAPQPQSQSQPQAQPQEKPTVQKPYFSVTNNVSRATFDYVRNNPGKTSHEIVSALEAQGYKSASTTSLLSQMRRAGTIGQMPDKCYIALSDTYKTPSQVNRRNKQTKPGKAKPMAQAPVWQPPPPLPVPPVTAPVASRTTLTAEEILNTLPIKQARALYDELHKIFG